ncbi:MAG: phosphate signaling complex protein PhoU [Armatimonadetes bacterium]|nr:phosphate signaling complex protein PhoU [Armatimonadota bacterium]
MPQTRQQFHEELAALDRQMLQMGTLVSRMMTQAVDALQQSDTAEAEAVLAQDDAVDAMNHDIEARCMRLLALQQPVARDLRLIGTAFKVITDLERIGDHAVDIAKISRKFSRQIPAGKPLIDVGPLAAMAQAMLLQSLEALIRRDMTLARQVCADDDRVDDEFKALREQLFQLSQGDPSFTPRVAYTLLAVVYLERIADHATNIAERVHYVETGELEPLAREHRLAALAQVA